MAQASFPFSTFYGSNGIPIADGYLLIRLNADCSTGSVQVMTRTVRVELDDSGTIIGDPQFYKNSSLIPTDSYYILDAYSAEGQRVLGPLLLTIE